MSDFVAIDAAVHRLNDDEGHNDWGQYIDDQQLLLAAWPALRAENEQLRAQLAQHSRTSFTEWRDYIDHTKQCWTDQAYWWNTTAADLIMRTSIPCTCGLKTKIDALGIAGLPDA